MKKKYRFLLCVCVMVFAFKENSFWILSWQLMVKPSAGKGKGWLAWDFVGMHHAVLSAGGGGVRDTKHFSKHVF